jgi:secondary thiamine-phosphate synthase enzyme
MAQGGGFSAHFLSARKGGIISITMRLVTDSISLSTRGDADIIDITPQVSTMLGRHGFKHGQALVFVSGSTAGITTIEYEPGLLKDIPEAFEKIAPRNARYHHEDTWHDGNGHSHVRAALLGCSLTVPFRDGRLLLGTWQQIVLIDFDNRPRMRDVIVQMSGE